MLNLYAEFEALPGREEELAQLVSSLASSVRLEPGNGLFDVYVNRDAPRRYFVLESYVSAEAFEYHLRAQHSIEFAERANPLMVGGGSTLTWLTRMGS